MHEADDYTRMIRLAKALLSQTQMGRVRWRERKSVRQSATYTTSTSSATISIGKASSVGLLVFMVQDASGEVIEQYSEGGVVYAPLAAELNEVLRKLWQEIDGESQRRKSYIDTVIDELHSPPNE